MRLTRMLTSAPVRNSVDTMTWIADCCILHFELGPYSSLCTNLIHLEHNQRFRGNFSFTSISFVQDVQVQNPTSLVVTLVSEGVREPITDDNVSEAERDPLANIILFLLVMGT